MRSYPGHGPQEIVSQESSQTRESENILDQAAHFKPRTFLQKRAGQSIFFAWNLDLVYNGTTKKGRLG
jgi:hypothetical protein